MYGHDRDYTIADRELMKLVEMDGLWSLTVMHSGRTLLMVVAVSYTNRFGSELRYEGER